MIAQSHLATGVRNGTEPSRAVVVQIDRCTIWSSHVHQLAVQVVEVTDQGRFCTYRWGSVGFLKIDSRVAEHVTRASRWGYGDKIAIGVIAVGDFAVIGQDLLRETADRVIPEGDGSTQGIGNAGQIALSIVCEGGGPRPLGSRDPSPQTVIGKAPWLDAGDLLFHQSPASVENAHSLPSCRSTAGELALDRLKGAAIETAIDRGDIGLRKQS